MSCTLLLFTAYAIVRTVPSANRPYRRKKKPVVVYFYGPANMTHKLSSACAETILSYHISPQQIFFTHKLEPVMSLFCGCVFVCVLCVFCFCLGLFLLLFLLLFLCVSVFVPWNVTRE